MKVEGLGLSKVQEVLKKVSAPVAHDIAIEQGPLAVVWVHKPYSGPGHKDVFAYGDIQVPVKTIGALTPHDQKNPAAGMKSTWKPCRHAAAVAVKRLLMAGATKVVFLKKHYTPFNSWKAINKSIAASYQAEFLMCPKSCPLLGGVNAPLAVKGPRQAKAAPVNPIALTKKIEVLPIVGRDLDFGETTETPTNRRSLMTAVYTFYSLAAVAAGLVLTPAPSPEHGDFIRYTIFKRKFAAFNDAYANRFARNLFDYLTLASVGEARHTEQLRIAYEGGLAVKKVEAIRHDPRFIIPALERVFSPKIVKWNNSFGGKLWANIARTAGKFFQFQAYPNWQIVFADNCIDLSHNGGLAFDKGFIFEQPESEAKYRQVLDAKAKGPIFNSGLTISINSDAYQFILEAVSLGLIERPTSKINLVEEPTVKTVSWGTLPVTLVACDNNVAAKVGQYEADLVAKQEAIAAEALAGKNDDKPLFFVGQTDEEVQAFINSLPIFKTKKQKEEEANA